MSRFDRPDPGADPEYCGALEAQADDPWTEPYRCIWCGAEIPEVDDHEPYCSRQCAIAAEGLV